ncbi:MAG: EF-P lysine aminoacylase GenX, partial [Bdellovibrionales bacterium]|nr:EF-P lysine aminoacylase GenX [Bdellovibrionales bacterium]
NDPVEQKKRFELTNQKRQKAEREVLPEDKDFMQALEYGLPPSAGIAMGIERLFMCFYEIKDIRELRSFSL